MRQIQCLSPDPNVGILIAQQNKDEFIAPEGGGEKKVLFPLGLSDQWGMTATQPTSLLHILANLHSETHRCKKKKNETKGDLGLSHFSWS